MHLLKPWRCACTIPILMISYERIHVINQRAPPNDMMNYKLGIQLFKLYNSKEHSLEWLHLNHNQILTSRQTHFKIMRSNTLRVGLNALANRLASINGKKNLMWLNLSYESFKIRCKEIFITKSINWQWYAQKHIQIIFNWYFSSLIYNEYYMCLEMWD